MPVKSHLLSSLPVFSASARLLSFKKAADELHVTASAVSQQIKLLETHLGEVLFERTSRGLILTANGQQYFELASSTLLHFELGLKNFKESIKERPLRLSTTPFIASEILIPAMHEFNHKDLRIETSESLIQLNAEGCDAAVRIGNGDWPNSISREIMPVEIAITAAPSLLKKCPFNDISDLKNYSLIHSSAKDNHWDGIETFFNINLSDNKQLIFDNYIAALSAAEKGLGLLVTLQPITNHRISDAKLTAVFESKDAKTGLSYYFVERRLDSTDIRHQELFEWVKNQFENIH